MLWQHFPPFLSEIFYKIGIKEHYRYSSRADVCYAFFFFKDLFIDWLLCWVFVSARELSLVAASGGHSSLRCAGLSLSRPLLLRSTGSRRAGSVVVAHGLCCSAACGILPDQGSNPCPLHWQADSQPLRYQGSPCYAFLFLMFTSLYCILINIISPTHKTPFSFT